MSALHTIGEYIRLARLHSSVLTGLTALFGALAIKAELEVQTIIFIFSIGIFVHIFGFVLNEYFDLEVDKKSKDLTDKPLVSGAVTPGSALAFALGSVVAAYLLLMFALEFIFSIWPFIFLTLTFGIFYAYDRWGKQLLVTDALLALFVGFLCLMGASIIAWPINAFALVIAVLAFLQLFLQNALAGMKDVSSDMEAGALTTPIRFGVRISEDNKRIHTPMGFINYIMIIKFIHIGIVFGFIFFSRQYEILNGFQISAIILITFIMLALLLKILSMQIFEREKLLRFIGGHEIVTYIIIPLLFIGILNPWTIILLIIFPIAWLACFMILMYGRLLPQI